MGDLGEVVRETGCGGDGSIALLPVAEAEMEEPAVVVVGFILICVCIFEVALYE
jgi:hypothetical protein